MSILTEKILNNCFNENKDLTQIVISYGIWALDKYQLENGIKEIFNDRKSRELKYENKFLEDDYDYLYISLILSGTNHQNTEFGLMIHNRIQECAVKLSNGCFIKTKLEECDFYFRHYYQYYFNNNVYDFSSLLIRKSLNKLINDELKNGEINLINEYLVV